MLNFKQLMRNGMPGITVGTSAIRAASWTGRHQRNWMKSRLFNQSLSTSQLHCPIGPPLKALSRASNPRRLKSTNVGPCENFHDVLDEWMPLLFAA